MENAVDGQQTSINTREQFQPAGRAPPTLRQPIDRSQPQSTIPSRFDQPIPRSNPGISRSSVRDTNRMHTFDNTRTPDQAFIAPQSRSMEPRFHQPPDLSRLNTSNIVSGDMKRYPVEQNPHPDGNMYMPTSPSGSRQQYSMTRGNSTEPREYRRRLTGEASLGGDFSRSRRGSAEKLLQSVLDECESLIDGLQIQKKE
jgi:hypothetical protein